jgi:sodium-dependent dicarboxylate transporter 2/3/5
MPEAVDHELFAPTGEREHQLERRKRLIGFLAGPLAALLVALLPLPSLSTDAHVLAAILAWIVLYWIVAPIPLPVTALLGTSACVLAGLGSAKSVFASYAHPVIFLFIGSFFLAEAMAVQGVDRRFATWMLSLPWVGARTSRMILAVGTVTAVISMWISNTAATALMLPVALGICRTLGGGSTQDQRRFRTALMLMLSYAATAGGVATIVGTPPNLIGIGLIADQAGVSISFLRWMAFGLPLAVLLLLIAWVLLLKLHPLGATVLPHLTSQLRAQREALGAWSRGELNACAAFVVAIVFWIGPGLLSAALGTRHPMSLWLDTHLPNELVGLMAAGLLFLLPVNLSRGEFTLSWKQALQIDWGTILLFGGGLAFGELMAKTGLSQAVGQGFVSAFGVSTLWSITAAAIAIAVLVSELTSNTAAASMLVPLAIAVAHSAGISAVPPALGVVLGASLGFALPVSTPPNAIVYGTGHVPIMSMIRSGLIFDLLGATLIWITLRLLCPLLGLD